MRCFPNNLYGAPQYIAGITFYPMGLFFGYYLNLFYLNHGTQQLLIEVAVWPICAGVLAAGVTAFIQVAIKITYKKCVYEHFYLLMIGLFSIFVGGIIISNNKTHVASSLYVCFIGHGICYVATLSYINIRTAKSEKRFLKISLSGFAYLTGIAVGSHSTITKVKQEIDPLNEYEEVNDVIGSQITLTGSFILVGYYVNEVLHWINSYDYKSSLDPDINRENSAKTLFLNKYFCVKRDNDDDGTTTNCRYEAKFPVKRKTRAFFFIYSNIIPVAYFYFPFIYFNNYTLGLKANYNFHVIYWFGVLGCSLSLIMQYFFTNRVIYFLTIVIKLIGLALLLLFLQILERDTHEIILYMLFCALGFHYQANDVNILSYGCLKYIEIEIFVSYMVQYIVIGIIQYWAIVAPEDFLNFDRDIMLPFYHSLIFMALFLVAIFLGAHVIPKGKQISLLEIKNIINHQLPPPMTIAHVLPSAPHLHQVYPHDNQQCFQPSLMLQHYPRVEFHHGNSQPYANNANQIVLIPAMCAGQKW